jgi:hypothetical protein
MPFERRFLRREIREVESRNYFRIADDPPALCSNSQLFGRRSAHLRTASRARQRDWPHLVNRYSTFGGTWKAPSRCLVTMLSS